MEGGDRDDLRLKFSEAGPGAPGRSTRNLPGNRARTANAADAERNTAISRNRYGEDQSHQHHAGAIQIETEVLNNDPTVVSPFMQLYHQAACLEDAQQLRNHERGEGLSAEGEPTQQCSSEAEEQDERAAAQLMARAQEQQSQHRFSRRFRGSKVVSQRTHLLQRAKAQRDQLQQPRDGRNQSKLRIKTFTINSPADFSQRQQLLSQGAASDRIMSGAATVASGAATSRLNQPE